MSLISRLRAVVAGDDYLDGDFDELDYETGDGFDSSNDSAKNPVPEPRSAQRPFRIDCLNK